LILIQIEALLKFSNEKPDNRSKKAGNLSWLSVWFAGKMKKIDKILFYIFMEKFKKCFLAKYFRMMPEIRRCSVKDKCGFE